MRPVVSPLAAAMVWAPMLTSPALSAGADFSGKTITVLVGYAVGGPVDGFARLVASRLGAYLPGRPTVIVQSKPGAGGVVAANYLYSAAPKDGSMLLVTIAPFTNQYIDAREIRFATDRFYWLGALNYSNAIYVHSSSGHPFARRHHEGPHANRGRRALSEFLSRPLHEYVSGSRRIQEL